MGAPGRLQRLNPVLTQVTINALGVPPRPQGSIAFKGMRGGKPIMVSDNADTLKPWRALIARTTREALGVAHEPLDEPVQVYARCWLPRPLRPRWSVPAVKPDGDKLARALLDGLADGGAYVNDSRVIDLRVGKRYADAEHPVGARIILVWGDSLDLR